MTGEGGPFIEGELVLSRLEMGHAQVKPRRGMAAVDGLQHLEFRRRRRGDHAVGGEHPVFRQAGEDIGVFAVQLPGALHGGDGFIMQAAFTLAVSVVMQTVLMGAYLAVRERDQLRAVIVHWRPSLLVGVAGVLASIFWFSAFTIQNAAYVRALGQVELIFTFIASVVFFREKIKKLEILGIVFIAGGILILVVAG